MIAYSFNIIQTVTHTNMSFRTHLHAFSYIKKGNYQVCTHIVTCHHLYAQVAQPLQRPIGHYKDYDGPKSRRKLVWCFGHLEIFHCSLLSYIISIASLQMEEFTSLFLLQSLSSHLYPALFTFRK